ncbi:uncharacterized protein F4822DRAFT_376577 [Hypoxylon trugodes]|uniref:uncharacterized protein n=1 Tax=Hypoxylon trugodes TaxID=326681 RepID=UPI0021959487|nr:uncharacterized protein F4822DRAFT_376577 [Hypoxylon trugodes]KAI1384901.1 hypothetical protein F4822DRAFT_376577 [Hypoxylon trugodes]
MSSSHRSIPQWLKDRFEHRKHKRSSKQGTRVSDHNASIASEYGPHQIIAQSIELRTPQGSSGCQNRPTEQEAIPAEEDAAVAAQPPDPGPKLLNTQTPIWAK